MANQIGKLLVRYKFINGSEYTIRASQHALEQMEIRDVSISDIVETISALRVSRLLYLQAMWENICLVNNRLNTTVIFRWVKNRIIVLTVLSKTDQVFAKNDTWYEYFDGELNSLKKRRQKKAVPA